MNLANAELKQISDALDNGEISSLELCEEYLNRIDNERQLNAFITVDREGATEKARKIDEARHNDAACGPLAGIPIAHKDIFCTKGLLTSCGSKILSNFVSPYDATVVEQLSAAGAITIGKTNMDEFAMGSSSEHSHYQPVLNPWDISRVPGGSSGGSAAAVAAGLVPAATGTDTGGSVRQPAAFCGITGVKPSYGRVSRFGMVAFASSLDQAGIFARSAEDAALLLDSMCGFDPKDSTSLDIPPPQCTQQLQTPLENLRIGVPEEYFTAGLDAKVGEIVQRAIGQFESLGASLIDVKLPNSDAAIPCYYVIAPAEASSNLSRFDGVRYGYRSDHGEDLEEMYRRTRSEGFGPEVRRRIMIGTYVLSHGYYDAYYVKAQQVRRLISDDYSRVFETCDLIVGPTTPTTAFEMGVKMSDPVLMYLNDVYTAAVNLAGLPAVSIPAGFDDLGLPVGLHIVAPYLQEARLLQAAHLYQNHTDYHLATPDLA
ncbi:MAG: Asp-tRNA(Asn)/Glu-tRNA(Gln) amidotransferase subunit GatA [Acidiferrobacterales bacterium]|nr:Asp-tRNA(Asn)/Glu-tRNA(Gln) amidotransferase subunit GatA [Acidiferrobacterales bacterium]